MTRASCSSMRFSRFMTRKLRSPVPSAAGRIDSACDAIIEDFRPYDVVVPAPWVRPVLSCVCPAPERHYLRLQRGHFLLVRHDVPPRNKNLRHTKILLSYTMGAGWDMHLCALGRRQVLQYFYPSLLTVVQRRNWYDGNDDTQRT